MPALCRIMASLCLTTFCTFGTASEDPRYEVLGVASGPTLPALGPACLASTALGPYLCSGPEHPILGAALSPLLVPDPQQALNFPPELWLPLDQLQQTHDFTVCSLGRWDAPGRGLPACPLTS